MTKKASPDEPTEGQYLARFLQDWTELWREEVRAQAEDPPGMTLAMLPNGVIASDVAAAMEAWRAAIAGWVGPPGVAPATSGDNAAPGAQAAAAASDAGDAAVERLARRVDELEARLAKLETAPRPARHRPPGRRRS